MDHKDVFAALQTVCSEVILALNGSRSNSSNADATDRLLGVMRQIQEHGRAVEPLITGFTAVYHHFDLDAQTPGNGYRTLVKVVLSCVTHILQKARYIASNCSGAFFRMDHNMAEMEAYCSALCQLRALLYLAQILLHDNAHGQLYSQEEGGLKDRFVQEYISMHKACFYGRCLGFQFSPSLRPFLQTAVISMVSFGENYKKKQTGLGIAALSFFTSGKYMVDPELRGTEFERITQNLDTQFWKTFWNLTETELLSDSAELLALSHPEGPQLSLPGGFSRQTAPLSPGLLIHFHGGGFVAQTSKSHENYLKSWSKELNVPVLSVDYSLAPEAPFPRALEECFYAYCWALKNCHLLGSTAERVCLVGESAGGNLCITVSMRAMSHGVRVPDGIVAAYPATLLTTDASPSRLLTLIDPLLPLSVLYKCIDAYAGSSCQSLQPAQQIDTLAALGQDTVKLLTNFTQGATNWFQNLLEPKAAAAASSSTIPSDAPSPSKSHSVEKPRVVQEYPENFQPLRSRCLVDMHTPCTPLMKNPFVSPLLAPDSLLKGLPPVHIVASALDALLDDSVMFAKKLRNMNQPVTLTVVEDLPHGFLSLVQLSKETQEASDICVKRIREVFQLEEQPADQRQQGLS
uniref:Hormone-sensitive lipase n=1 Tax=Cyprinus carpio carpio TaxID=630221 RepID=A0A9J8A9Q4_CYPCA